MPPHNQNLCSAFFFHACVYALPNESRLLSFFLSPFPFPKVFCRFLFFALMSLVYYTWAQVSLGRCNLRYGAGTLLLLYISFTTTPAFSTLPSCHASLYFPFFLVFFLLPLPSHMYFYQLSIVSSTCHFHVLLVCIHPCVFPILSRLVDLLYIALSLAIVAGVSHHLFVFPFF